MINESFPTLPLALVHKMIAFYLENRREVDAYVADQELDLGQQIAQSGATPSLSELRDRLDAKRRADAPAFGPVDAH